MVGAPAPGQAPPRPYTASGEGPSPTGVRCRSGCLWAQKPLNRAEIKLWVTLSGQHPEGDRQARRDLTTGPLRLTQGCQQVLAGPSPALQKSGPGKAGLSGRLGWAGRDWGLPRKLQNCPSQSVATAGCGAIGGGGAGGWSPWRWRPALCPALCSHACDFRVSWGVHE